MSWREKALLRPRELADVASLSLRTIRRRIKTGEIESRLVDGCRVIPVREVLRFVGELRSPTASLDERAERRAAEIESHFRRRRA